MSVGRDPDAVLDLDELARRAAAGDREALTVLLRRLQHPMYRLALRFLGHPQDAQDACQEILIRIVSLHQDSTNRFLVRSRPEQFAALLDAGMANIDTTLEDAEFRLLCEEVRISCTYGMLLCIPRAQRTAYLLADVIGLTDVEGAEILDCSREAFRQRSLVCGARCAT